jgi:hypothetical protein
MKACLLLWGLIWAAAVQASAPDSPAVTLLESTEANRAFGDVTAPDVSIPLTFVAAGKKVTVKLESTACLSANGISAEYTFASEPKAGSLEKTVSFVLGPNELHRIYLRVSLPIAGNYRCVLEPEVLVGTSRAEIPAVTFSIGRTRAAPPIEIAAVPALQQTTDWSEAMRQVPVSIQVYATGEPIEVPPPRLLTATHKPKSDSAAGTLTTLSLVPDSEQPPEHHVVGPGSPLTLPVMFDQIGEPGRYDATLRFDLPGYQPIDTTVTIYVRQPGRYAFFVILAGVVLSFGLHLYVANRPTVQLAERVATMLDQARAARAAAQASGDAEAQRLVDTVSQTIKQKWDARRWAPVGTAMDVYEEIVPGLTLWIDAHAQVLAVRPREAVAALTTQLDTARDEFIASSPDAAKVRAAIQALRTLPATIRTAVKKTLTEAIDPLLQRLQADPRQTMADVCNLLIQARSKADGGQLEAGTGLFDAARQRYVGILAQDLRRRVDDHAVRPYGLKDQEWKDLKLATNRALGEIVGAADADQAMERLKVATHQYLNHFGAALRSAATGLPDEANIGKALTEMSDDVGKGNLPGAWRKLDEAQGLFLKAQVKVVGKVQGMDELSAATASPGVAFDPVTAINLAPSSSFLGQPAAARRVAQIRIALDALVSVLVFVVAAAIGIQTLWIGNPTWGGLAAWLAAFLWGFAADQFTHAGVTALVKRT